MKGLRIPQGIACRQVWLIVIWIAFSAASLLIGLLTVGLHISWEKWLLYVVIPSIIAVATGPWDATVEVQESRLVPRTWSERTVFQKAMLLVWYLLILRLMWITEYPAEALAAVTLGLFEGILTIRLEKKYGLPLVVVFRKRHDEDS